MHLFALVKCESPKSLVILYAIGWGEVTFGMRSENRLAQEVRYLFVGGPLMSVLWRERSRLTCITLPFGCNQIFPCLSSSSEVDIQH